jgi:hypothetical protein
MFFYAWYPDEAKEKSGTPCKINLKNTQPTFDLLVVEKVHSRVVAGIKE